MTWITGSAIHNIMWYQSILRVHLSVNISELVFIPILFEIFTDRLKDIELFLYRCSPFVHFFFFWMDLAVTWPLFFFFLFLYVRTTKTSINCCQFSYSLRLIRKILT